MVCLVVDNLVEPDNETSAHDNDNDLDQQERSIFPLDTTLPSVTAETECVDNDVYLTKDVSVNSFLLTATEEIRIHRNLLNSTSCNNFSESIWTLSIYSTKCLVVN